VLAVAQYRQKEVAQHGSREAFHQAQLREVEQKVALRRTELTFGGPRTKDGSPDKRTKEWKVRPVLPIVDRWHAKKPAGSERVRCC